MLLAKRILREQKRTLGRGKVKGELYIPDYADIEGRTPLVSPWLPPE